MDKVYIDCNIILDWLIDRDPFSIYASRLISLIETKKIKGCISPLILANAFYILTKQYNKNIAFEFIKDCEKIFKILNITERIVKEAISAKNVDFEDDLHYFTAKANNIQKIITRNKKDFIKNTIEVITAEEYLKKHTN